MFSEIYSEKEYVISGRCFLSINWFVVDLIHIYLPGRDKLVLAGYFGLV